MTRNGKKFDLIIRQLALLAKQHATGVRAKAHQRWADLRRPVITALVMSKAALSVAPKESLHAKIYLVGHVALR